MSHMRYSYRMLVGKPGRKRLHGSRRHKWKYSIKMDVNKWICENSRVLGKYSICSVRCPSYSCDNGCSSQPFVAGGHRRYVDGDIAGTVPTLVS
jgi:hypothetical protein